MQALQGHIVRAIDVGYGNVKFSIRHKDILSEVECQMFPSLSPLATERGLAAGLVRSLNTVEVDVNGVKYEVGQQAALAQGAYDDSSLLDKDFCLSDAYMARLKGALYFMQGQTPDDGKKLLDCGLIDLLMVGLPVSAYRNKNLRKTLQEKIQGAHELPNNHHIVIEKVLVMPQPMGALFDYAAKNDMLDNMQDQLNLILDPGFFTFDWLLTAGLAPIEARSNSASRGMSAVIEEIAKAICLDKQWNVDGSKLSGHIAEFFNSRKPVVWNQIEVNPMNYLSAAQPVIVQAAQQLTRSVGDPGDIQNIILAGGGASLYFDTIQARFPHHKILVADNPVFSNVRGFQRAGELQILAKLRNANKAAIKAAS